MKDKIAKAVAHQQSGQFGEAEKLYRKVLANNANDADALHFLGVLLSQTGRGAEGLVLIQKALEIRPNYTDACSNLGRLQVELGRFTAAIHTFRSLVKLQPFDSVALYQLGLSLRRAGQDEEALTVFQRAVGLRPSLAGAYSELGNILRSKGQLAESVIHHQEALRLQPSSPDFHNNLGNVYLDQGNLEAAIAQYLSALQLDRGRVMFHINLGSALARLERNDESLIAYEHALGMAPDCVEALAGVGIILSKRGQQAEAIQYLARALAIDPNHVISLLSLGEICIEEHRISDAKPFFERALAQQPRSANGWIGMGSIARSEGDFDQATNCFKKALEIDPQNATAIKHLAQMGHGADAELVRLETVLSDSNASNEDRVAAGFGMGKLLEDAQRYDEAFSRFAAANALFREMRSREGDRFDKEKLALLVDRQIAAFPRDYFRSTRDWGNTSEAPVFIVGMPRSGTTLVEQIAASHPQVFGAGELNDIDQIGKALLTDQLDEQGRWTRPAIHREADRHLAHLEGLSAGALRVVDKMPGNILNLAIVADLFPKARVIFCQRDPRDTCLSCYFQWFGRNGLIFSYDLEDSAWQYLQQERLATHWNQNLPLRMLTVQYEEMVGDLEGQSRRLIEFLGLAWDPRCLEFYKTKRNVNTASVWQVRQPIYTQSVGRWRHYVKHLGLLFNALHLAPDAPNQS